MTRRGKARRGKARLTFCGEVLFGESPAKTEWFERMRLVLISEGFPGVERELSRLKTGLNKKQLGAVDSLLEYLRNNARRLHYRERLAAGRAIGSGLIEELGGASFEADGGLLAVAACESHCVSLCRSLLPPV